MSVPKDHIYSPSTQEEIRLASDSARILAACHGRGNTARLRLIDDDKDITVPVKAIHMLADILHMMEHYLFLFLLMGLMERYLFLFLSTELTI